MSKAKDAGLDAAFNDLMLRCEKHGDLEGHETWVGDLEELLEEAWRRLPHDDKVALLACTAAQDIYTLTEE